MASVTTTSARRGSSFDVLQPIWRLLTSVRFAVFFIATLAAFGLTGVLIPQIPEAMRGNQTAINAWLETKHGTFGPLTDPMYRVGLFSVFHARWFIVALGFLVVNVTTCTFNRWSPTFRNVFHPPERVPDRFFEHAHNRVTVEAASPGDVTSALHKLRYRVKTREEGGATYVFADRNAWTQLATFVSHLALILFIAGGLVTNLTGFTSNAFAGEGTTVPVFAVKNPNQLQVRIDDAIGKFGDKGNALDFRTHLTIFRNGQEVKSGVTTVNDPLKYDGYRFHQVAFLSDGAQLRIKDLATGNVVFDETFPLDQTTAAPAVTITDANGATLFSDVIAPTDLLPLASGALVSVPGSGRIVWIGITPKDEKTWQLVAFDPQAEAADAQLRVDQGATGAISGLNVRFDRVALLPSAVGVGVPGAEKPLLAEMQDLPAGGKALLLLGEDRPAIALGAGEPVQSNGYEYEFVAQREFAGISVKRDSGAWFIWIATGMLLGGLLVTFYVPRRRLWMKLTGDGTQIAALAEKSGGFHKDMRTLATRIGVPVPAELEEER